MTSPPVNATGMLCNCTWWWNHDLKSNKHIKVGEQFLWGWMFHFHVWKKTRWNKPITMQVEPLCKNICPTGNQQEKMRYLRKRIIGKSNGGLSETYYVGSSGLKTWNSSISTTWVGFIYFPKHPGLVGPDFGKIQRLSDQWKSTDLQFYCLAILSLRFLH